MKDEYLSAEFEPAHQHGPFKPDPAEYTADPTGGPQDTIDAIRDSALNEPAFAGTGQQTELARWIADKRAGCSTAGNLSVALLAALLGGPFAIFGAMFTGTGTWYASLYAVLFAPIIEELLKQSGMIYLLERRPYRIFAKWQFVFSALLSAMVFATLENLLYLRVYVRPEALANPELFVRWRWIVCTSVHLICSVIASCGMIHVWTKQQADGKPADLSAAFPWFVAAIAIHGSYNFVAIFLDPFF